MVIYIPNEHVAPLLVLLNRLLADKLPEDERQAVESCKRSAEYEVGQNPYRIYLQNKEERQKQKDLKSRAKLLKRKPHVSSRKR